MRRRVLISIAVLVMTALVAGCGSSSSSSSSTSSTTAAAASTTAPQVGFEGIPIESGAEIASPATTGTRDVDGITCGATEQLAYHIHAHLAVYVDGQPRALPAGIGIPGSQVVQSSEGPLANGGQCIYWLHTHAPDGVIHIESPTQRIYTLGNFFDVWRQPLTANHVAGASGKVTALVNGKLWTKPFRDIPLNSHAVVQLSVGTPVVPFHSVSWSGTQL
jgi:hypothetical protein